MKSCQKNLGILALGLAAAAWCNPAAGAYRNEVSPGYFGSADARHNEVHVYSLAGTRYLAEVRADEGPLAEAAFLERVGSIAGEGSWHEVDLGGDRGDGPGFALAFTYASPRLPVWGEVSYARSDVNFGNRADADLNSQTVSGRVGYWLAKGLTAGLRYQRFDRDFDFPGGSTSETYDDAGGFGRWVCLLPREQAFALSASYTVSHFDLDGETGTDTVLSASADYYFAPDLSLGAVATWEEGDNDFLAGKTLGARLEAFLFTRFGVSAFYEYFWPDTDRGSGTWQLSLGAKARF